MLDLRVTSFCLAILCIPVGQAMGRERCLASLHYNIADQEFLQIQTEYVKFDKSHHDSTGFLWVYKRYKKVSILLEGYSIAVDGYNLGVELNSPCEEPPEVAKAILDFRLAVTAWEVTP